MPMGRPKGSGVVSAEERFWRHVELEPNSGCWIWVGARGKSGYGNFWDGESYLNSHVFSFNLLVGPTPVDYELDHTCRLRCCVNPRHLEVVSHFTNLLRGNTVMTYQLARFENRTRTNHAA